MLLVSFVVHGSGGPGCWTEPNRRSTLFRLTTTSTCLLQAGLLK